MINNIFNDIVFEMSKYLSRKSFLNFLSSCKRIKLYNYLFFDKYIINISLNDINDYNIYQQFFHKLKKIKYVYNSDIFKYTPFITSITFGSAFNQSVDELPLYG